MTEYIYLCQLREHIKTNENIYKLGKTKQENLKRFKSYPNGTILICQFKCINCDLIEKKLLILFKEKYELQKDIGNEYFKGSCSSMVDDIYNYIKNENTNDIIIDEDDEILIKKTFPNYKNDESYGGNKKLIKIKIKLNKIYIYTIYNFNKNRFRSKDFIILDWFKKNDDDNSDYISKLINNNVIKNGIIYDFNNEKFINNLNKYKEKIKLSYTEINIEFLELKYKKNIIYNTLFTNCILNDKIFCDYMNNTLYFHYDLNINDKENIYVVKINNIYYDYAFLRKYTPYFIEINNNEYYFYNRDYEVINKNNKIYSIDNFNGERKYFKSEIGILLYNDDNNILFKKYIKNINLEILNKDCMNMNDNTNYILKLFD